TPSARWWPRPPPITSLPPPRGAPRPRWWTRRSATIPRSTRRRRWPRRCSPTRSTRRRRTGCTRGSGRRSSRASKPCGRRRPRGGARPAHPSEAAALAGRQPEQSGRRPPPWSRGSPQALRGKGDAMGTCKSGLLGCLVVVLGLAGCGGSGEEAGGDGARPAAAGVVHVYNWSDYIAEDTIPGFERETGIKVTYGKVDSNELLEAKLLAGGSGFDVVVPSLQFLGRQIQAGVFQPLDKSRLENYSGLDPALMERIAIQDPGNQYAVPYLWGTTGIGYNVDKVVEAFGSAEVADSWSLLFDPDKVSKLAHCGVMLLDTPSEAIPAALAYLGEDPNSHDPEVIRKGAALLAKIRPYIRTFHSSQYIDALANGSACLVMGWSGDVLQARDRAEEAGNGVKVAYAIPKEGAPLFFDMLAIPRD